MATLSNGTVTEPGHFPPGRSRATGCCPGSGSRHRGGGAAVILARHTGRRRKPSLRRRLTARWHARRTRKAIELAPTRRGFTNSGCTSEGWQV